MWFLIIWNIIGFDIFRRTFFYAQCKYIIEPSMKNLRCEVGFLIIVKQINCNNNVSNTISILDGGRLKPPLYAEIMRWKMYV